MKTLDFGKIFVKHEIVKSCEYINEALRFITSDPELCILVKSFLGLSSTNGDSPRMVRPSTRKDSIEVITIPCGQSVDSFVNSWVFEVDDAKQMAENIHWTKYLILARQDPIVESLASMMAICLMYRASLLIKAAINKMNLRCDVIYGGFCYICYNYGLRKGNKTAKANATSESTIQDSSEKKKNVLGIGEETKETTIGIKIEERDFIREDKKATEEILSVKNKREDVLDLDIPGLRATFGPDCKPTPSIRLCFYCCEEGKEHPIEHFVRYPCCGYFICRDCVKIDECGECLTRLPTGNTPAISWISSPQSNIFGQKCRLEREEGRRLQLMGRLFIRGAHTFLDELIRLPYYNYKKFEPPPFMFAAMNPTQVQDGVQLLETAAMNHENIATMLDLADTYCTIFKNDSFQPNIKKAEEWYIKALGKNDSYSPMAFTRYGDFLMNNGRYDEAKSAYTVAAIGGHPRGEYEYAKYLLNETSTKEEFDHDNMEKALKVLCATSKKGFLVPSYTLLVKTLIEIFQKQHGTVYVTGKSPLPRILQILRLALKSEHFYGFPDYSIEMRQWEKETSDLLELYEESLTKCSNCGQKGSKENPLRFCEGCDKSVAYCSNICQRRDFRDGHKFDCCSPKHLFDFDSLRLTLPWVSTSGSKRHENDPLPRLSGTTERSLLQMVEDDTDEIYGEEVQDYDETVLHNMMFRMRKNLETYLSREMNDFSNKNLHSKIIDFGKRYENHYSECENFVETMHCIRELGNNAVHYNDMDKETKITQMECEHVVQSYRIEKEQYEKFKEHSKISSNVHEENMCNDLTTASCEDSTENDNKIASVEKKDCIFAEISDCGRGLNSSHDTQEPNQKKHIDSALVKKNPEEVGNLTCSTDVTQTSDKKKKKRKTKKRVQKQKKK